MTHRVTLLDRSTTDVVRRVAGGYLSDAEAALARLPNRRDSEALHDFRVSIRRLRSLLRAYGEWVGRAGGKKVRRRLRALGSATNAGRDAEVQLAWVEGQRTELGRGERTGLNWLVRRLRTSRREGYRVARRGVRDDFARACDMLTRRLAELDDGAPPFRETFAVLLRRHAAALETRLGALRGPDEEEDAHEARIAAKRLRYLLEPLAREEPTVRSLVTRLKRLQDVLGELHDMHVLETALADALDEVATAKAHELRGLALAGDAAALRRARRRDERLGLVALAARARACRDALFGSLSADWLGSAGRSFFQDASAAADRLERAPAQPIERERKYLLARLPDMVIERAAHTIEQGWLPGDRLRERLRRVQDDAGEHLYRTVKLGEGLERVEIEEETTPELFARLWPLTEGCRIVKRRYRVPEGSLIWEIDDFCDRDLVLAEVELPPDIERPPTPAWLDGVLVREVTGDPAYLNLTLASTAPEAEEATPDDGASPHADRPASLRRSSAHT